MNNTKYMFVCFLFFWGTGILDYWFRKSSKKKPLSRSSKDYFISFGLESKHFSETRSQSFNPLELPVSNSCTSLLPSVKRVPSVSNKDLLMWNYWFCFVMATAERNFYTTISIKILAIGAISRVEGQPAGLAASNLCW